MTESHPRPLAPLAGARAGGADDLALILAVGRGFVGVRVTDRAARLGGPRKERDESRDPPKKAWLDARIAKREAEWNDLEARVGRAAGEIRRNAKVGVWADASSDLVESMVR